MVRSSGSGSGGGGGSGSTRQQWQQRGARTHPPTCAASSTSSPVRTRGARALGAPSCVDLRASSSTSELLALQKGLCRGVGVGGVGGWMGGWWLGLG